MLKNWSVRQELKHTIVWRIKDEQGSKNTYPHITYDSNTSNRLGSRIGKAS